MRQLLNLRILIQRRYPWLATSYGQRISLLYNALAEDYLHLIRAPAGFFSKLCRIRPKRLRIDEFTDEEIHCYFVFDSKDEVKRLLHGFRFPETVIIHGNRCLGESILLVGLHRLSVPNTLNGAFWREVNPNCCYYLFTLTRSNSGYGH